MRILAALDGNPFSELTLTAIVPLLRQAGDEAVLIRVVGDADIRATYSSGPSLRAPSPLSTAFVPSEQPPRVAEDRGQAIQRVNSEAAEYLARVAKANLPGISYRCVVEWSDNAGDAIGQAATRERADLIALATHGRSGSGRSTLGRVADAAVRLSRVPVILVGAGVTG